MGIEVRSSALDMMSLECILDIQVETLNRQVDLGVGVMGEIRVGRRHFGIINKSMRFQVVGLHVMT